jgi:hypothetical protein
MVMETVLTYRGRVITTTDVQFIHDLIAKHPEASRRALSKHLCEAWDWRQANGALRDQVCRSMMLELHRADHIELPPVRCRPPNPLARRSKPEKVEIDSSLIATTLSELGPLQIDLVRRTAEESLWNGLVETHHYLGYTQPVGEHLKYLITALDRPIACLTFSSAPRHLGPRDRFIGWSAQARRSNIRFLAYNCRFLILPWVKVKYLASHVLGRIAGQISEDWQQQYGHPVYYLETFVDPSLFKGTCYRAANWVDLGWTTGRGKDAPTKRPNRPLKQVLGYPLTRRFRERLGTG